MHTALFFVYIEMHAACCTMRVAAFISLLISAATCHEVEEHDTLRTMLIDDVVWIIGVIILIGLLVFFCFFVDSPIYNTPVACPPHDCCDSRHVVCVRIEHGDAVKKIPPNQTLYDEDGVNKCQPNQTRYDDRDRP